MGEVDGVVADDEDVMAELLAHAARLVGVQVELHPHARPRQERHSEQDDEGDHHWRVPSLHVVGLLGGGGGGVAPLAWRVGWLALLTCVCSPHEFSGFTHTIRWYRVLCEWRRVRGKVEQQGGCVKNEKGRNAVSSEQDTFLLVLGLRWTPDQTLAHPHRRIKYRLELIPKEPPSAKEPI